jgi:hypothetical protein
MVLDQGKAAGRGIAEAGGLGLNPGLGLAAQQQAQLARGIEPGGKFAPRHSPQGIARARRLARLRALARR